MRLLKHMSNDMMIVALDKGEAMPSDGPIVVGGVSYDVDELTPPDNGFGSDVVFAVRYKRTKRTNLQQPAQIKSKWNSNKRN